MIQDPKVRGAKQNEKLIFLKILYEKHYDDTKYLRTVVSRSLNET